MHTRPRDPLTRRSSPAPHRQPRSRAQAAARAATRLSAGLLMGVVLGVFSSAPADEIPVTSVIEGFSTTLRVAIEEANTLPGGPHTIVFDVEGVYQPTSSLPHLLVDGTQIRGERNSGGDPCPGDLPRFTIDGSLAGPCPGLYVEAHDCIVTGLEIRQCLGPGIYIAEGKTGNQIGTPGSGSCERVHLCLNRSGITIPGENTEQNAVRNCRIFENEYNGIELIAGPDFNTIGADIEGERNYIYGNGTNGVLLTTTCEYNTADLQGNLIAGNYIYANDSHGILGVGDAFPALLQETMIRRNRIGVQEPDAAAGNGLDGVRLTGGSPFNYILENVIVDNAHNGISLLEESDEDSVAANAIGVLDTGVAMGNHGFGIYAQTDANSIGPDNVVMHNGDGSTTYAGIGLLDGDGYAPAYNTIWENVVSSNAGRGVTIAGADTGENLLRGCFIGTDANSANLGNSYDGVVLEDSTRTNYVRACVIGWNGGDGIRVQDGAFDNELLSNRIGTDVLTELALGNARSGILLKAGSNQIGGTGLNSGNTICWNDGWGIRCTSDEIQDETRILQNLIGTNADGDEMGNASGGVWFGSGFINNQLGDWPDFERAPNTIMFNVGPGVRIGESGALHVPVQNRVLTNRICRNAAAPIALIEDGNDLLPPPEVEEAGNRILLPEFAAVGVVAGRIGYAHPPDVPTRIQVFYDTPDTCSAYYGQADVSGTEESWSVVGEMLPRDAVVYATETTRGPNSPPQSNSQTSGISESLEWGWWELWNGHCDGDRLPCPWLGTMDEGRSVSWVDYDGDTWPDFLICNAGSENRMLRNLGTGTFEIADVGDLTATLDNSISAAWADYDNDGDVDVYLVNAGSANRLFANDGLGGFADVTPEGLDDTGPGRCAAWADHDLDGDLDLFLTNHGTADLLCTNNGDLTFEISQPSEEPDWEQNLSVGAGWGDYDNDGDPDLYIMLDGASNLLLRNDRELGFVNVTSGPEGDPGAGRGVVWGDFQNDGLLDLYIANYDGPNRLLRGTGIMAYPFEDVTAGPEGDAGAGRGLSAGDFDLDGDLDLYIVNDTGGNRLLVNDGTGTFDLIDDPEPMPDGGFFAGPLADYDGDGDVDLFVVSGETQSDNVFLANVQAEGNHWLHVDLDGAISNRYGIGARIEITTVADGMRSVQMREVSAGTGTLGQGAVTEEFGLGEAERVEMVRVTWPSGRVSELFDVLADRRILIEEPGPDDVEIDPHGDRLTTGLLPCRPNPTSAGVRASFALAEAGHVELEVYDAAGRVVHSLVAGHRDRGVHEIRWDGCDPSGRPVPAGVYYLSFSSRAVQQRRALTVIH
ncbi:MAG: hypothetical protein GF330_07570 [Candidatus Eisenbacteria bacterium]|nr:hypothetical protein [Candidatus Eisenbacteria bacterium]